MRDEGEGGTSSSVSTNRREDLPVLRADLADHEHRQRQLLWGVRGWTALLAVLLPLGIVQSRWFGLLFAGFLWSLAAVNIFRKHREASARTARLRQEIEDISRGVVARVPPRRDEPEA